MLPVEEGLVVEELGARAVDDLLTEGLVLQQLEEVQAQRVLDELHVARLLPVLRAASGTQVKHYATFFMLNIFAARVRA